MSDTSRGESKSILSMEKSRSGELAQTADAARAKAEIEASYTVAIHRPRSIADARTRILEACKRSRFAASAKYKKPIGGGTVDGPSIRFAEEIAKLFGNIRTSADTVYEDDDVRKIRVSATDMETNLQHAIEISMRKVVERKKIRAGMEVLAERENSQGQTVYLIKATDDDMLSKTQAQVSKALRTVLLRLIPQDIIEEAMDVVSETLRSGVAKDPAKHQKAIADAFSGIGVRPGDLEAYLKHPLDATTPAEIEDLRAIYNAISSDETTWQEFIAESDDSMEGATKSRAEALRQRLKRAKPPVEPQEPKKEPTPPTPPEEAKDAPKRRGRPPKPKPDSSGPFVMTDKMVDEIQDMATKCGWKPDDLRDWVQDQYSCGLKGVGSQIVLGEIMHFIQDVPKEGA